MAEEQKKTIQDQVDYHLSPADGSLWTIRVDGCEGPCELPDYVNGQFYSCNFESLKTNNNILYFYKCTFKKDFTNFNLRNSACIFEECTFSSKVTFNSSKVEFIKCKVQQSIFVQNKSSLKSKDSDWTAIDGSFNKVGLFVLKARAESIKDTWGKWEEFSVKGQNNSFISIVNPVKIKNYATFTYLSKNSSAEIWDFSEIKNEKDSTILFDINSSSKLETFNVKKFSSVGTLLKCKDSVVKLNKVTSCQSAKGLIEADSSDIYLNSEILKNTSTGKSLFDLTKSKVSIVGVKEIESQDETFKATSSYIDIIGLSSLATIKAKAKETFNLKSSSIFVKVFDKITSDSDYVITGTENSKIYCYSIKELKTSSSSKEGISLDQSICTLLNITDILSKDKSTLKINNNARLQVLNVQNIKMENSGSTSDAAINVGNNSSALVTNTRTIEGAHAFKVGDFSRLTVKNVLGAKAINSSGNGLDIGTNAVVNMVSCNSLEGKEYVIKCNGIGNKITTKSVQKMSSQKGIYLYESNLTIDNSSAGASSTFDGEKINLVSSKGVGSFTFSCIGPMTMLTKIEAQNYNIVLQGIKDVIESRLTNCVLNGKFISINYFEAKGTNVDIANSVVGPVDLSDLCISHFGLSTIESINSRKSLVRTSAVKVNRETIIKESSILDADYINTTRIEGAQSSIRVANVKTPTIDLDQGEAVFFGMRTVGAIVNTGKHGRSSSTITSAFIDTYSNMFLSAQDRFDLRADFVRQTSINSFELESLDLTMTIIAETELRLLGANVVINAQDTDFMLTAQTELKLNVGGSTIDMLPAQIDIISPSVNIG